MGGSLSLAALAIALVVGIVLVLDPVRTCRPARHWLPWNSQYREGIGYRAQLVYALIVAFVLAVPIENTRDWRGTVTAPATPGR